MTMTAQQFRATLASTIGKNLRATRSRMGLTQEQTAERVGITIEFYGRMERGQALPSLKTLVRMADIMKTTPNGLLKR